MKAIVSEALADLQIKTKAINGGTNSEHKRRLIASAINAAKALIAVLKALD